MDLHERGHASARSQWVARTLGPVARGMLLRHPALRWFAPAGVLGVVIITAAGMLQAGATTDDLPDTSPGALIAAAQSPGAAGFSGTVVSRVSLGLPELPTVTGSATSSSMAALLSGTHTLQVWYGGATKQRIALLGATEETDVFRNGRQVWHWNSADRVAVHTVLPKPVRSTSVLPQPALSADSAPAASAASTFTPQTLARQVLGAIDPSTQVRVIANRSVADRTAYELVLRPRSSASRVGSVHIAIDGATKVPLGVQVYPRGSSKAAIDLAYTSIHFAQPAETYFQFSPPTGARVRQQPADSTLADVADRLSDPFGASIASAPRSIFRADAGTTPQGRVSGSDWSTVVEYVNGAPLTTGGTFEQALTRVHGRWGTGRLLDTDLVSVLITDNGRVYAGAVDPSALYTAAGKK